ncbi:MAG: leucine-rich repeat protein [Clostridia bacterium]|nr:leucine-rich repeat protein [Clostridia bacterium]
MKKTNKLISILLVMAMLLSMAPLSLTASAADIEVYATGTLGSGSRTAWTIYDNGLLVIDGKGNSVSTKWDSTTASPWKDYADIITRASFVNCENWECIPECTFRSLSKLKDVTLPENIEEICQYAFTGTAIETILLPDGLITIGYYAFSSCESLKYININDGVTSIGSSAFYNCSSLKAISIPDSVTSIGQTLFQNCTNLEYVRLSENADKVGGSMFSGCTMLKNVSLPASVTVIGSKAFSNASNLEGVYYHGVNEPTTYNPGINNATFSLAPDTMVIYASNDYSATTMGLKANWENDVQTVTKIEGHFVNIAHTANGAVKVGASIVPAGDTVTIDIMAYKNYELDTITVTDSNGQVELSGSGHSRTFSMPEGDVRISATFKSTATPHVHSWTYAANGATITATCAYADTCHNPISKVEISKGNTSSLTFRPDNAKYMTVSGTMEDVVIPDLVYTLKSTGEPTTPINPGVYVASLTIENVTATYEFEITRGNFNYTYFTYTAPQNLTYDGTPKYASVVMSEDYVPYAGEYTVYYNSGTTEPINAGTYTVKVNVAESDYFTAGTALSGRAWRFTIAPKSIEDLTYEGLGTSYPVGATPDVTIKHGDMVLVKDTDYTVEYANNTELGTATMTVTGVGNYTGSKTLEFEIVPHTHSFTYSASGDTITAVCANTDGNCPDPEGTLTILAPADLYADGITAKEATIENNLVDTSVAISYIIYSAPYGLPPKDAGTYTASVTVGGATATVEFTLLNYAAKVTDKDGNELPGSPYKTFAAAVRAAEKSEGSTITLLDDVNLTSMLEIASGKFILDLNGKTIINPDGIEIGSAAELTIVDSASGGKISGDMFGILNDGSLTVNGGVIKASCAVYNYGTVTVDGGNIQGYITNNGALIVNDGILTRIKNPNTSYTATVEINGGTFTDFNTIENNDGDITVKGGIYPNGFSVTNDGNLEYTANSILAEDYYYKDADGKLIDVADDAKIINGYVKVSKGADLSEAVVTVDKTEFVYNGQHQAPAVTVTIGGKTLKENVDYAVNARRWENGVPVQWFYYVDAGAYLLTVNGMGDYTGKVEKEFVIKPATVDIIWEGDEFYYTGTPHKVAAKYIDIDGNESNEFELINYVNTNVGVYTATVIFADNNYSATEATINHTYEIKWYDGAPDATVSGTKGENGWYTSEVTVTAPEGYAISTLADGIYGSEVTFGNEEKVVYYLKQAENGYIAKVELGEIKCDLADPAAEITMAENKWNSFFNTVTFGYFFKETQSITITASDETSGIAKIEYFIATEEIADFENVEWIEYTEVFTIQPNSKNIIYAKATDNAGRYVIVNSDGIVIYTDSTLDTSFKDEVVYVLTKNASQAFNLNLNGNTVAYVKIDETVLTTEDYEVLGNMILVSAEVLENLAAGEYVITVGFNPMGEEFVDGDSPAEVTIPLTVKKADVTIEISDFGKVYDGKPVTADYKISKSSDSSPAASNIDYNETVEFKVKDSDDSTYTTEAPVNAGEYTVRVSVAETGKSTAASATKDFTIAKKAVTVTATAPDKVYDGTDAVDMSNVILIFEGIVEGDEVKIVIKNGIFTNSNVGEKKRVIIAYTASGEDLNNYKFPEDDMIGIPEADPNLHYAFAVASITAKDISDGFIILGDALTFNGTEQTQTVEKVLPSGTAPEATYTVSGNKATNVGVYLLTVTGTGNFTGEAKIAFEIAVDVSGLDYSEADGYYWSDVKSTDKDRIEYVYNQIRNASTEYADEDKKAEWNTLLNNCNEMLLMIKSVTDHLESFKEEVAGYGIDTVTSDDYDYLEGLYESEGQWLYDHSENYTDEEIKEFSDTLDDLQKLKIRISDVAKEITRITNAVNGYDEETVKSSDKADLEQLKADIKALTDGQNITDGEREKLAELDAKLDDLLKKIADTQAEIDELGKNVDSYTEDSVKSSDKEDLAQIKEDIQNLIDSDNTTENEKTALEDMIKDIEGLEDKIAETEQQLEDIKDIENGYNPETVTSDDKAAIEDKIAEIEAVNSDNLTDEQKAEYEEIKAGFEALLEEIAAAEKDVADIGVELETFDEERVTKFWEDDIEALKAKIDELLADENMGETEKAKLNGYKAQAEKLIEIINTPKEYISCRFFYLIWDCLTWKYNGILWLFSKIFSY